MKSNNVKKQEKYDNGCIHKEIVRIVSIGEM